MTPTDPTQRLTKHLLQSQTSLGRRKLNAYLTWKRAAWWWAMSGASLLKRGLDICGSLAALLIFSPVFAMIAFLIKLEDRGPIFFNQTRVGRFGRHFKMYKFRSMSVNAEAKMKELLAQNQHKDGVTFKIKDDPRITKVGKWLRKLSLDELPQFYNVLLGDMSLVGPRPPIPREVAIYTPTDRRRLAAIPGITCFWQIGGRSEIDFNGQVALDVQYIESQSFWLDVKILIKTIPAVLCSKGAY
ncbi:MAG: sugar transferase [Verrucomicrobia bacterium]|nr:sugar transferase [Verrucomicrobiota bacterium]